MTFNVFILISLLYTLIGLRVVYQLVIHRQETFDRRFTAADRLLVDQAAFFVLIPISVALHELGHAAAIKAFGGDVAGWGYYFFAGDVSFYPDQFTDAQRILIAAAGTIVNVVLIALALAWVFGRRPPVRAAYNELLIQFAILSGLNALVVYPLLDVLTGLGGDWSQMYRGGVPALSGAIFIVHAGLLGLGWWAWKNPPVRARIDDLTGMPAGAERPLLGGLRATRRVVDAPAATPEEQVLREAASRVASGWPVPLEGVIQRRGDSLAVALVWVDAGVRRSAIATVAADGVTDVWAAIDDAGDDRMVPPQRRLLERLPSLPDADALTLILRRAMEAAQALGPRAEPTEVDRSVT